MFVYLLSLPVWNFVLPTYAFWKFDDFSWGDTRKTAGETTKKAGLEYEGEFDSSKITMRRWRDFEAGKIDVFVEVMLSLTVDPYRAETEDTSGDIGWRMATAPTATGI